MRILYCMVMDKEEARWLRLAEQHERCRQVIFAGKRGINERQIGRDVALSYWAVCNIVVLFERGRAKARAPWQRGRKPGEQRTLKAERELQRICGHRPEPLKRDFALGSCPAVQQLIEREHERSVGKYLTCWGFTPQKPIRGAYEQSAQAVKSWLDEDSPAIAKRAKAEGAKIHWGDETALLNTEVRGRSFAPKGQTPVVRLIGGTRQKLSMICTVTHQGKAHGMIIDGAFNHERLIEFFEAWLDRKVFVILENVGVRHCKPLKAWLAEHSEPIDVFYLPRYSPELNPDERLKADLKHVIGSKVPRRTKAKLYEVTHEHRTRLEQQPLRVRDYFQDPYSKYAA